VTMAQPPFVTRRMTEAEEAKIMRQTLNQALNKVTARLQAHPLQRSGPTLAERRAETQARTLLQSPNPTAANRPTGDPTVPLIPAQAPMPSPPAVVVTLPGGAPKTTAAPLLRPPAKLTAVTHAPKAQGTRKRGASDEASEEADSSGSYDAALPQSRAKKPNIAAAAQRTRPIVAILMNTQQARDNGTKLSRMLENCIVTDRSSTPEFTLWTQKVEKLSNTIFGPDWSKNLECLNIVTNTFKYDLETDWYSVRTKVQKEDKRPDVVPEAYGWDYIKAWVEQQLNREVIDEELTARQLMLSGKITQGSKSVTDFINRIVRASKKIPNITEYDKIIWFLNGVNESLKHVCCSDAKGKTWILFEDLREHALAKEMEFNSRQRSLKIPESKAPFFIKKARFAQANHTKLSPPPNHSLAYTKVQDGGQQAAIDRERTGHGQRYKEVIRKTHFTGPPQEYCPMNPQLSNEQGNWLWNEKKCVHCGQPKHMEADGKTAKQCRLKGTAVPFGFLGPQGLPQWKAKK
jgi:hypothetical protein